MLLHCPAFRVQRFDLGPFCTQKMWQLFYEISSTRCSRVLEDPVKFEASGLQELDVSDRFSVRGRSAFYSICMSGSQCSIRSVKKVTRRICRCTRPDSSAWIDLSRVAHHAVPPTFPAPREACGRGSAATDRPGPGDAALSPPAIGVDNNSTRQLPVPPREIAQAPALVHCAPVMLSCCAPGRIIDGLLSPVGRPSLSPVMVPFDLRLKKFYMHKVLNEIYLQNFFMDWCNFT